MQAAAGHGQVVALVGEAGVGKSRLAYEFVHAPQPQGWLVLESASVSYGKATPYFPVLDLLRRYCHLEEYDDPRTVQAKVTGQVLTLDEALQDHPPALLSLLEVLPDDSAFRSLDPPQRRQQRLLTALKRVLLRESQMQPLLLVFEDLHWIDAETQALLDSLVESLPWRLLLLVNYRPEYQHGWGSKTYYTQLRLDAPPPAKCGALLQALLGDDPSLAPLKQLLITRTAGNPSSWRRACALWWRPGCWWANLERTAWRRRCPLFRCRPRCRPCLQHASTGCRQRRSGSCKRRPWWAPGALTPVAGHCRGARGHTAPRPGAAGGRVLYEDACSPSRNTPSSMPDTRGGLRRLPAAGAAAGTARALVEALEALALERVAEQVERLAHHALQGEVWDKAVPYCQQAGARANDRAAFREAVAYFDQALRPSGTCPSPATPGC